MRGGGVGLGSLGLPFLKTPPSSLCHPALCPASLSLTQPPEPAVDSHPGGAGGGHHRPAQLPPGFLQAQDCPAGNTGPASLTRGDGDLQRVLKVTSAVLHPASPEPGDLFPC